MTELAFKLDLCDPQSPPTGPKKCSFNQGWEIEVGSMGGGETQGAFPAEREEQEEP